MKESKAIQLQYTVVDSEKLKSAVLVLFSQNTEQFFSLQYTK